MALPLLKSNSNLNYFYLSIEWGRFRAVLTFLLLFFCPYLEDLPSLHVRTEYDEESLQWGLIFCTRMSDNIYTTVSSKTSKWRKTGASHSSTSEQGKGGKAEKMNKL